MSLAYSVDMVRLSVRVKTKLFQRFINENFAISPNVEYRQMFKFKAFRHNFTIKENSGSFWLGFWHNSENPSNEHILVIEYNPNKILEENLLDKVLNSFYNDLKKIRVSSCDVAIDFPVNIDDVIIDKKGKVNYKLFDYGGDNKTHYLGSGDGRIKIYNKARESGLSTDLTRYEVSCKINIKLADINKFEFQGSLVSVYLKNAECNELNDTDKCLLWAIQNGYPINQLSRDKQKKLSVHMGENKKIEIEQKKITSTIIDWFQGFNFRRFVNSIPQNYYIENLEYEETEDIHQLTFSFKP